MDYKEFCDNTIKDILKALDVPQEGFYEYDMFLELTEKLETEALKILQRCVDSEMRIRNTDN